MEFFEKLKNIKDAYPTLGKPLKKNKNGIKIWVISLAIVSITGLFYSLFINGFIVELQKIEIIPTLLFFILGITFKIFYSYKSYKSKRIDIMDVSLYLSIISIIQFQNLLILLLTVLINLSISFFFGIRRIHAIIFNGASQILNLIPVYWFLNFIFIKDFATLQILKYLFPLNFLPV